MLCSKLIFFVAELSNINYTIYFFTKQDLVILIFKGLVNQVYLGKTMLNYKAIIKRFLKYDVLNIQRCCQFIFPCCFLEVVF